MNLRIPVLMRCPNPACRVVHPRMELRELYVVPDEEGVRVDALWACGACEAVDWATEEQGTA